MPRRTPPEPPLPLPGDEAGAPRPRADAFPSLVDEEWDEARRPPPIGGRGDTAATHSDVMLPVEGGAIRDRVIAGRYAILDVIGAGGMGNVYAAWDERLGRKVAIKMLRAKVAEGSNGALRLEREARALARLNHDHVVRVFDVGQSDEGPFLAMELVEGRSLEEELHRRRAGREDIVALFLAAGRGLAAAHRLGIVHRDVKAANILVGTDGRSRISDFGIATWTEEPVAAEPIGRDDDRALTFSSLSGPRMTEEGALLGTPACMAPEQLRGEVVDAKGDQFSFCLALHTAVFGEDPFPAKDTLLARYERMKSSPAVPARRWPALERVLARGLSFTPSERFPSMEELLGALDRVVHPPVRQRWHSAAALGLGILVVAALVLWRGRDPCGLESKEQGTRALKAALVLPAYIDDAIEAWLARWTRVAQGVCQVTHLDEEEPHRTLDCLRAQLDDVGMLLALLEEKSMVPEVAQQAIHALMRPEACLEGASSVGATRSQRESLARARVALFAGDFEGARKEAMALRAEVTVSGVEALLAEVAWVLGRAETALGHLDDAAATLREGVAAALAARAPRVEAALWIALVDVLVDKQKKLDEGLHVLPMMQAAVRRLPDDVDLTIEALMVEALVDNERDAKSEGAKRTERAFALALAREPLSPTLIARAGNLHSILLYLTGQYRAAIDSLRRTRAALEQPGTSPHLRLAYLDNSLGLALWASGDVDGAERAFAAAIEVIEAQREPRTHESLWAAPLVNLAALALQRGDLELARTRALTASQMLDRTVGPGHPRHSYSDEVLAHVAAAEGRHEEALRRVRAWRDRHRDQPGHEHAVSAALLESVLQAEKRRGKGLVSLKSALVKLAPTSKAGEAERQVYLVALRYMRGDGDDARGALEVAREYAKGGNLSPSLRALLEELARVLDGGSCEQVSRWHPLGRLTRSACLARCR